MATEAMFVSSTVSWALSSDITGVVTWIGTIVSIVGLVITLAVYNSTSAIRKEFLVSARVPRQLEDVKKYQIVISSYLNGTDLNNSELLEAIAKLTAIVESLSEKLTKKQSPLIHSKLSLVQAELMSFQSTKTAESLTELWIKTTSTVEAMTQWLGDRDWSKNNGD
jgi:hypothetical protein